MSYKKFNDIELSRIGMGNMRLPVKKDVEEHSIDYDKPSDCINCKKCLKHCPQNIETPKYMKELAELMK